MHRYHLLAFILLGLLKLPGLVVWCLTLIWGNSQAQLFQIFFLFLSFFHYVYITPFVVVLQSLDLLGFFFFFFSRLYFLSFSVLRILLIHHLVQRFLPQQRLIYWAHQRYHFCYGGAFFLICSISFWFFLGITYLSAYTAHLSLHATLSLETLVS